MSKVFSRQFRVALIGTGSLVAQEIREALAASSLPLKSIEFYDPGVEEEYSQLTNLRAKLRSSIILTPICWKGWIWFSWLLIARPT